MKITSKRRSYLRKLGQKLDPVVRIGKDGLTENVIQSLNDALNTRELVKVKILQNSDEDTKEAARKIAETISGELIFILGRTILIFKENEDKPVISKDLKEI